MKVYYSSVEPRLKLNHMPDSDGHQKSGYQHIFNNGSLIYDAEVPEQAALIADLDDRLAKHDNISRLVRKLDPVGAIAELQERLKKADPVGMMVTGSLSSAHMHASVLTLGAGEEAAIQNLMEQGASREDSEKTVASMRNGMALLIDGKKTTQDAGAIKSIPLNEALGTRLNPIPDGAGDINVAKASFTDVLAAAKARNGA